jgi:hypothetical protein
LSRVSDQGDKKLKVRQGSALDFGAQSGKVMAEDAERKVTVVDAQ